MMRNYWRGWSCRGMGFGFRGWSPPYPYIGRGRGGLPRCAYYLDADRGVPSVSPSEESEILRAQAERLKKELERIEARLRDIEADKAK